MITIFSCNRPKMLLDTLKHLDNFNQEALVIDDNSSYNFDEYLEYADYYRSQDKLGKENYWMQWRTAFNICQKSEDDLYIFTPDDFQNLDIDRIEKTHLTLQDRAYSCNIINDGREECFRRYRPIPTTINDEEFKEIGFNDGGFFCNRKTLSLLNFRFDPIPKGRFHGDPLISSGIGQQLTMRMRDAGIYMLMPVESMAYHGDHKSIMNPEERKRNPLISR